MNIRLLPLYFLFLLVQWASCKPRQRPQTLQGNSNVEYLCGGPKPPLRQIVPALCDDPTLIRLLSNAPPALSSNHQRKTSKTPTSPSSLVDPMQASGSNTMRHSHPLPLRPFYDGQQMLMAQGQGVLFKPYRPMLTQLHKLAMAPSTRSSYHPASAHPPPPEHYHPHHHHHHAPPIRRLNYVLHGSNFHPDLLNSFPMATPYNAPPNVPELNHPLFYSPLYNDIQYLEPNPYVTAQVIDDFMRAEKDEELRKLRKQRDQLRKSSGNKRKGKSRKSKQRKQRKSKQEDNKIDDDEEEGGEEEEAKPEDMKDDDEEEEPTSEDGPGEEQAGEQEDPDGGGGGESEPSGPSSDQDDASSQGRARPPPVEVTLEGNPRRKTEIEFPNLDSPYNPQRIPRLQPVSSGNTFTRGYYKKPEFHHFTNQDPRKDFVLLPVHETKMENIPHRPPPPPPSMAAKDPENMSPEEVDKQNRDQERMLNDSLYKHLVGRRPLHQTVIRKMVKLPMVEQEIRVGESHRKNIRF